MSPMELPATGCQTISQVIATNEGQSWGQA